MSESKLHRLQRCRVGAVAIAYDIVTVERKHFFVFRVKPLECVGVEVEPHFLGLSRLQFDLSEISELHDRAVGVSRTAYVDLHRLSARLFAFVGLTPTALSSRPIESEFYIS